MGEEEDSQREERIGRGTEERKNRSVTNILLYSYLLIRTYKATQLKT